MLQGLVITGLITCGIYLGLKVHFEEKISAEHPADTHETTGVRTNRNHSYRFTQPLIGFDIPNESANLQDVKLQLRKVINENCSNGNLYQASVYLRDLENGEWTSLNEDITYHPGSLIKVPMLIYYLKESETHPEILNKTLRIDQPLSGLPAQTYTKESIEFNKSYTVKELLKYMASYSDNRATYLLNTNCDEERFKKVFSDLNLQIPDIHDTNYTISVSDYSVFMRVLFNATYLNPVNSDFALSLLTESNFDSGITRQLPSDVTVARKFGEMKIANKRELHECGIIYCNKRPYMVTIMTKGYNASQLAQVIGSISDTIFHFFCA